MLPEQVTCRNVHQSKLLLQNLALCTFSRCFFFLSPIVAHAGPPFFLISRVIRWPSSATIITLLLGMNAHIGVRMVLLRRRCSQHDHHAPGKVWHGSRGTICLLRIPIDNRSTVHVSKTVIFCAIDLRVFFSFVIFRFFEFSSWLFSSFLSTRVVYSSPNR